MTLPAFPSVTDTSLIDSDGVPELPLPKRIVRESSTGLWAGSVVVNSARYWRYLPAGLVIAPGIASGADQLLHAVPSVDVRVLTSKLVPEGVVTLQSVDVQADDVGPKSNVQLW